MIYGAMKDPELRTRFERKVARRADDKCWPWLGGLTSSGYGMQRCGSAVAPAHRVAWVLANGRDIPEGLVIDHLCGSRTCCNPAHLEAVTQSENVRRSEKYKAGDGEVVRIGPTTYRPYTGTRVMAIWREYLDTGKVRQRGKRFNTEAEAREWVLNVQHDSASGRV
jgi:hypothetical protein